MSRTKQTQRSTGVKARTRPPVLDRKADEEWHRWSAGDTMTEQERNYYLRSRTTN